MLPEKGFIERRVKVRIRQGEAGELRKGREVDIMPFCLIKALHQSDLIVCRIPMSKVPLTDKLPLRACEAGVCSAYARARYNTSLPCLARISATASANLATLRTISIMLI